jgi:hypothetical protein
MSHEAESALRELRRGVWAVPDAETEAERRVHIAARVLELQRELALRSARRRLYGLGLAAAALLFGGVFGWFLLGAEPATPLHWLGRETSELVVTKADESVELRLASNTALSVAPASELALSRREPAEGGLDERVELRAGSVTLSVPKLGPRDRLAVETRDARVEVRGTHFSVRVVDRSPLAPYTEVKVSEGSVLVRAAGRSHLVGATQSFRSIDVAPLGSVEPEEVHAPSVAAPEPSPAAPLEAQRPRREPAPRPVSTPSELAAQNRLLEAAELAQKSGMPALALQRLELLLERYPEAELAHNARVERFRLLRGMGLTREAELAARQYLQAHPNGFAREEAQRLVAAPR